MSLAPTTTEGHTESATWTVTGESGHGRQRRCLIQEIQSREGEVLYRYPGGTVTVNPWVPAQTHALALETVKALLRGRFAAPELLTRNDAGVALYEIKLGTLDDPADIVIVDSGSHPPESALAAREVRDLSGLSAERLGLVFGIERETYQRWIAGRITPSSANLERLLALRHFIRELAHRVESPKTWLLSPLSYEGSTPTPYELLKTGNLHALWDLAAGQASRAPRYSRETENEGSLTVVSGSLRGRDYRATEEELDDYSELLNEGE